MTNPDLPELLPGEVMIEPSQEQLWRNQNPSWVDVNGAVTSQLFKTVKSRWPGRAS